jgi:hypothetical protein
MKIKAICFILFLMPLAAACEPAPPKIPGQIVLAAGDNDGHSPAWTKRHYYGLNTWGIRGSEKSEEGEIWFSSFPGPSGRYEVQLSGVFENDGSPHIAVYAGEKALFTGRFPYPSGKKDCSARGERGMLVLGTHNITHGEKIRVWGRSVYECGEKGAYSLWDRLLFTPAESLNASVNK